MKMTRMHFRGPYVRLKKTGFRVEGGILIISGWTLIPDLFIGALNRRIEEQESTLDACGYAIAQLYSWGYTRRDAVVEPHTKPNS